MKSYFWHWITGDMAQTHQYIKLGPMHTQGSLLVLFSKGQAGCFSRCGYQMENSPELINPTQIINQHNPIYIYASF